MELESRGNEVLVMSREKEMTTDLLDYLNIRHIPISVKRGGMGLGFEWALRFIKSGQIVKKFDPDVMITRLNPVTVTYGSVFDIDTIVFDQNEFENIV